MIRFGAPLLFVLIWSTGFVVARVAAPRADLLSASYWAIGRGLAVGVMALLGALQPLFTALLVATGRTMLAARTRSGLLIGFGGVGLVLAPSLSNEGVGLSGLTVGAALLSVVAVTAGTLFQKWLAKTDLRSAASVQNLGAAVICALVMLDGGSGRWDGTLILWSSLAWAVLVLSVVGTTLLIWMMRHGEATKVTALLLLVPPLAAIQALVFFRETLAPLQIVGFALALGGVLLSRSARLRI